MSRELKAYFSPSRYTAYIRRFFAPTYRRSYSQIGEDLIIQSIFKTLKIPNPSYLDIGTNDPVSINNTYLFYRKGWKGVCVEPDPILCRKIRRIRPRDSVVNAGIGLDNREKADFYLMDDHRLNTFSKDEALRMKAMGHGIKSVVQIPLISVNTLIKERFVAGPNLVSLDTEGMDLSILESFDFKLRRPEVFCVETVAYERGRPGRKLSEISAFMERNGYVVFSDTYINTIFVDKKTWDKARQFADHAA